MPDEVRALTDELHAVLVELRRVGDRLDSIEHRARTEWRRAWWHRLVSALLLVIAVALIMGFIDMRRQRTENCESVRSAFDTYTQALADFSSASAERTPEEEAGFDRRVQLFRAEIAARLADCT